MVNSDHRWTCVGVPNCAARHKLDVHTIGVNPESVYELTTPL